MLTAGDRQPDAFDSRDRELAELIGVTCEAAFDRIERTETLRERSRKLDERTRQLEHTKELNDAIRQTNQALSTAETRQEIFDAVCEHVGSLSFIEFSWIAERAIGERTVSPAAWSDGSRAYLDAFDFPLGDDASEPGVNAGREETAVHVANIARDVQSADWRSAALRHGYRGALAVPIAYEGTTYGSLAVYAAEQDTFDGSFQSILGELGDIVGRELSAQDRKDALFGRRPVSIELTIDTVPSPEDPLVWLTGELDSALTVRNVLPQDRGYLIYATCTDVTGERLRGTASAIDGIEAVRRVRGTDPCEEGGCLFEFHVRDAGVISRLVDLGVRSQDVAIVGDRTRISATIPSTMDPETILTELQSSYPSVSLESTSVSHETVDAADAFVLTNAPTDAQREAIEAAFEAGFFEWPRDSSSQEVADALDISQPSFSQRLRAGQQKVVESYCRDTGGSDLYRL